MREERRLIELLKALLKREVELFCRRNASAWKIPIFDILDEIHRNNWRAAFFGGTLRSLLMSRLLHRKDGRPRDVDIVIHGPPLDILRKLFDHFVSRETRFGGLQLRRADWVFDVWPLEQTWAIIEERIINPEFADLPRTTFLNLEAVAIEVWPRPGRDREIYSGNDQFFKGLIDRVVEVNRLENPFPDLCVVRSLVMTGELGFRVGERLARYIAHHGRRLGIPELERVQEHHYGQVRVAGETLREWIRFVAESVDRSAVLDLYLPLETRQPLLTNADTYPYDFLRTVERWHRRRGHHLA
jgi:hypothetical protein